MYGYGTKTVWTNEMVEDLVDCMIDNMTMEQASVVLSKKYKMNLSRNALIGKWRRFVEERFGGPQ